MQLCHPYVAFAYNVFFVTEACKVFWLHHVYVSGKHAYFCYVIEQIKRYNTSASNVKGPKKEIRVRSNY